MRLPAVSTVGHWNTAPVPATYRPLSETKEALLGRLVHRHNITTTELPSTAGGFGMKETGAPYYDGYSGLAQDMVICKCNTVAAPFGPHVAG